MDIQQIDDRAALADYFRRNTPLHLYSLGDLDDFYWSHCTYYGEISSGSLKDVCLFYRGEGLPILLALGDVRADFLQQLIGSLPAEVYAHLSPGLDQVFRTGYQVKDHGPHFKMVLNDFSPLLHLDPGDVVPITASDLPAVIQLYQDSYPDNAFDLRMLETGMYFGLRRAGKLASIAGVHVYSPRYRVAALGNITTHPEFRGRGFARIVTTHLCQQLAHKVGVIGLNVKADNLAAIALYQRLGFRISDEYGEFSLQKGA